MRTVYLVGTDHRFQRVGSFGVPEEVFAEFTAQLKQLITERAIRGIAEEMSIEGLGLHRIHGGSLAFHLARELGLPHAYCDPPKTVREQQCIVSLADRERYWLDQLRAFTAFPCLFILGADHTASFSQLLNESGFIATVLFGDWSPSSHVEA
jgi:hypothetical protein